MKKKISRILGVGVSLALLTSLLMVAPVSAISTPTATVDDATDEISEPSADYSIHFQILEELVPTDTITITFPEDTTVAGAVTATIDASPGWTGGGWANSVTTNGAWSTVPADREVVFTLGAGDVIGETANVRVEITAGITNPSTPGDYTLTVETSEEDAEESTSYTITPPDPTIPPGTVRVYNPGGYEFDPQTGDNAINDALAVAGDGWTLVIEEGVYPNPVPTTLGLEDLTIRGAPGEDVVIENDMTIDGDGVLLEGITIDGDLEVQSDDVVVQDCTIDNGGTLWTNGSADLLVQDCTFNVEDEIGVEINNAGTTVTGCTFNVEEDGDGVELNADGTVSDSTFIGSSGAGVDVNAGDSTVSGCTFDGLENAIWLDGGNVTATGNTISGCTGPAILGDATGDALISGNTFTGNDEAPILEVNANDDLVHMMFNIISDNAGDDGLLLDNNDGSDDLNCANNYWGSRSGPPAGAASDDVITTPWLVGPVTANTHMNAGLMSNQIFDAIDEAGVRVEATDENAGGPFPMGILAATTYQANPGEDIPGTVANYWDVAVINPNAGITEFTVRIYDPSMNDTTEVYVWGESFGNWLECSNYTINLFSGFASIVVDADSTPTIDDLEGLPFAVVTPTTAAIGVSPAIVTPAFGADSASVTPTFTWSAVAGATEYQMVLALEPEFLVPEESATSAVNGYVLPEPLEYSTTYYWRVRAVIVYEVEGEEVTEQSGWTMGMFTTMAEPAPPPEEGDIIVEQPDAPDITIEAPAAPDVTVEIAPDEVVQVIPDYLLWVIIGVGAVLVIAVIVLIVRTRRVS
jgi:hypothetical protein